jgi:hypothetical protein
LSVSELKRRQAASTAPDEGARSGTTEDPSRPVSHNIPSTMGMAKTTAATTARRLGGGLGWAIPYGTKDAHQQPLFKIVPRARPRPLREPRPTQSQGERPPLDSRAPVGETRVVGDPRSKTGFKSRSRKCTRIGCGSGGGVGVPSNFSIRF